MARRVQALLAFKEQYIDTTVAAQVIGTSGSDQSRALYIDKGSNDGIKPDMAVITPGGIVGKMAQVFPDSSQVLPINDQFSGVGAALKESRLQGILKGAPNGSTTLQYIMSDEKVSPGEEVITSGGDRIFPKGLEVGKVASVAPGKDLFLNIRVIPSAHLDRLEEVLVVTKIEERAPDTNGSGATARVGHSGGAFAGRAEQDRSGCRRQRQTWRRHGGGCESGWRNRDWRGETGNSRYDGRGKARHGHADYETGERRGGDEARERNGNEACAWRNHHEARERSGGHDNEACDQADERSNHQAGAHRTPHIPQPPPLRISRRRRIHNAGAAGRSRANVHAAGGPAAAAMSSRVMPFRGSFTSREQVAVYEFSWPEHFCPADRGADPDLHPGGVRFLPVIDLPLMVVLFFALARRNPVSGCITGCIIGLMQDLFAGPHHPLGMYGVSKTIVGYAASSLGLKIDVENPGSRFLITYIFFVAHQGIYYGVAHGLLRQARSGVGATWRCQRWPMR